ncbi:MAG: ABC transporter ATP-binding protein [Nitrospinota bacterium]|jgi:NitT/TauT family transport system ATP-binding protein|nr:ABC transporter ATP-binding protein [Nitrospinota bacterium]HJM44101.1 ABC transporter ATP-binding protein [Nitrospinota bacterium]
MIHVEGLSFSYGSAPVLEDLSLRLPAGGSLAVIGPSGCGKTTLLYNLAGLLNPGAGRVLVGGGEVRGPRERTAVILQHYGLFPWKTVYENAALGLRIRGVPADARRRRVEDILEELGIAGLQTRYPGQLSGGQRQRVAIARALAQDPDLLIMDEPFSSLDALTREAHQNLLLSLWREKGVTLVLVSHSVDEAAFLGREILVLSEEPARIRCVLSNPGMGSEEYRRHPDYQRVCTELRDLLKGAGDEARV